MCANTNTTTHDHNHNRLSTLIARSSLAHVGFDLQIYIHTHVSCVFILFSSFNRCTIIDLPLNKTCQGIGFHSFYTVLLLFFLFFCFISLFWFSFFFLHYLFGVYRQWRIRTLRKTNVCLTASRFLRVGPVALCICFVIQCFVCYSLL